MALTVNFWVFEKKENSTAQPLFADVTANYTNVELFENTTVVNPILKILAPIATTVFNWNYCRIVEFNRYYYVRDWEWSKGYWVCYLEVDPLASFRIAIGTQSVYILRAYHDYQGNNLFDGNIIDTEYPCTAAQATYTSSAVDNPFFLSADNAELGTYVVGIVNANAANGSVTYYVMSITQFRSMCSKLFDYNDGWLDIDINEISENLQKALVNPFQYVVSAMYLPIPVGYFSTNNIGASTNTVYFGWWSVAVSSVRVISTVTKYSLTTSLTIPKHPSASTRGNYLNVSPYTIYTLRYYPFGTVDIDTEALAGWNTLDCYMSLDVCTGKAILNLCVNGHNNPIRTLEAQVGVGIPTASIQVDFMNLGSKSTAVLAAASTAAQVTSGSGSWWDNIVEKGKNFVANIKAGGFRETVFPAAANAAKQVYSNITSAALASKATVEITGQQGANSLFQDQTLTLSGRFLPIANEDFVHRGRPLCAIRTINSMSGYILCKNADINIACTEREKEAIKAYMESGFYFE